MTDEQKTERVQLLMTPSELKAIDDWSFANRVRGRSEAIRQLIRATLGQAGLRAFDTKAEVQLTPPRAGEL